MLDRLFPYHQYRSVRLYYILTVLLNCFFIQAVWYFVYRHFLSNTQIGVSDAIVFGAGFLFELPSGVWADFVGRHKAVRLGFAGMAIGNVIIGFGSSFWVLTIGFLIWTLGYTFQSGALDALVYDNLLRDQHEVISTVWPQVLARAQILNRTTTMACTLLGGLLYVVWFRLPFLAFGVTALMGLVFALRLPADTPQERPHKIWRPAAYKGQIVRGFRVLIVPEVRVVALLALLVGALDYALSWGILRPLVGVRFGFTATTLPVLQVVATISGIIALLLVGRRLKTQRAVSRFIGVMAVVYGLSFAAIGLTHNLWFGGGLYVALESVSVVAAVAFSIFVNRHTKSQHRATTLSTVSMLQRAPYAFLAVLLGWLAGRGLIGAFCLIAGLIIAAAALLFSPKWLRENNSIGRL